MTSDYYLQFENKFRGNRKTIIKRFSMYDSLIELCIRDNREVSLLDIGCGRGEWLEKWKEGIPNSKGIEKDLNMCNLCKSFGLDVINGKAVDILSSLESNSISIITIFHMIEHIENEKIMILFSKCNELLNKHGVLLIETPSIDNLLVSSKTFYVDPTHINHINPDGLIFNLDKIGFGCSKNFYINGGPLKNDCASKITRVFNGVAQDLLTIAVKSSIVSTRLYHDNTQWMHNLGLAPTTLEAAIEFDLENIKFRQRIKNIDDKIITIEDQLHKENKIEIELLKKEISHLKSQLKFVLIILRSLKLFIKPFMNLIRYIKKFLFDLLQNILNKVAMYISIRKIINSTIFLYLFKILVNLFPKFMKNKTLYKLDKFYKSNFLSDRFNRQLLLHFQNSQQTKSYYRLLKNKIKNSEK